MSRNEIKLRRKKVSAGDIQRYRNYALLLKQLERTKRFKRALRIFIYSLVVTGFVLMLIMFVAYFIMHMGKNKQPRQNKEVTAWVNNIPDSTFKIPD